MAERPSDDVSSPQNHPVESKGATAEVEMQSQTTSKAPAPEATAAPSYPGALKQSILLVALLLAMFIVALDMVRSRQLVFSSSLGWVVSN
jgi:3-oxoacyl-ACP reductase-like protein